MEELEEVVPDESIEERRRKFAEWPGVFATIKLFRAEDGEVDAVTQYEGPQLEAAGVPVEVAGKCYFAFRSVQQAIPKALFLAELVGGLASVITAGGEDDSESEGNGGSGSGESTSADGSVSGDNQGGSVCTLGGPEDTTNRLLD